MRSLRHFFYQLRGRWLEDFARNKISEFKDGEYRLSAQIPYVAQYASPEMVAWYVKDDEYLRGDEKWKDSGAKTIDEYIFWAPKLCGMACFKMILSTLGCPTTKLVELGKRALLAGVYKKKSNNPKRLVGMLHAQFLKFAEEFNLGGKLIWHIGSYAVAGEILKNNFVIASVSNEIRRRAARPKDKTGHLILVHGFKIDGGKISGFYIHNPSGFFNESQENYFVQIEDFISCFSGRIIVLWKK